MCKMVLGLIGDVADCIGPHIKDYLKQGYIEKLVVHLNNQTDTEYTETANWAMKRIEQSIRS